MAIVQCKNHHYYDDSRDDTCPYCEKLKSDFPNSDCYNGLEEQLTVFKADSAFSDEEDYKLTEAYGEATDAEEKTIGVYSVREGNLLTAGWLVCTDGAVRGQSFVFYSGRNFAGRSDDMHIVISDDPEIAREKHFSIVYAPKSIRYFIIEGNGRTY
ncbi:MAG: FHA domain-containing protein, partial [Eubacterium sp.]